MAEIQSNIRINVDTTGALASIKALQGQISAFHSAMAKSGAAAAANSANLQSNLINSINAGGKFAASMTTVKSTTESFTTALEKNKLSMTEYFRYAGGASKSFGKLFSSEFNTINKVAIERVKDLQTQYIKMGRDANGAMQAIKVRPLALDMNNLSTQTAIAAQKQQILNQVLKQGSTNLLNFGKNTQWAGRQLMVGFSIPLMMIGTAAAKTYMQMETASLQLRRVYGDLQTTDQETAKMVQNVRQLGSEFTKFGIAASDTMDLAAKIAATGKMGSELLAQVRETSRIAALGGITQDKALETTISLTNAFGVSAKELATNVDFLNFTQNQTILSLDDMTTAIPKAAPVVRQLGGDVKDLAFFLTAMREGGINASEGANALKSGLASIINPTKAASDFLGKFNINLSGIVTANKGNIKGTVIALGDALNKLDPLNRAQAIEKLFGKFQFARISTLLKNVTDANSQAAKVTEIGAKSKEELAILSERELKKVSDSPMNKFRKAVQDLKVTLIPLGEEFLKAVMPLTKFLAGILKQFNSLGDGTKSIFTNLSIWIAGVAPIALMVFGLFANGIANIIKGFAFVKSFLNNIGKGTLALGEQTHYLTQEQINAEAASAALDQAHQKLKQTFTSETEAVDMLAASYANAIRKQMAFAGGMAGPGKAVPKFATGGLISGPGTGTSDSIIARVSNGEAIIPANSVAAHPQLVSQLIAGNVPGFAYGGGYFPSKPYRSPAQIAFAEEQRIRREQRAAAEAATPEGQARAKRQAEARKRELPPAFLYDPSIAGELVSGHPLTQRVKRDQYVGPILFVTTKSGVNFTLDQAYRLMREGGMGAGSNRWNVVHPDQVKALGERYNVNVYGPEGKVIKRFAEGGIVGRPSSAVVAFGAHQPFTAAHEMIANLGKEMAIKEGSTFKQFSTAQGKSKRSLLSDRLKKKLISESIGVTPEIVKNPFELMAALSTQGYKDITLLLGEDRMGAGVFDIAASRYGLNLKKVGIPRDPSSPSGTQTRLAITNNDVLEYERLIASNASQKTKDAVFREMRSGLPKFLSGGIVRGPGNGTSDSILARISNGEAVIPASSVAAHPELVNSLISGNLRKFVEGGVNGRLMNIGGTTVTPYSANSEKAMLILAEKMSANTQLESILVDALQTLNTTEKLTKEQMRIAIVEVAKAKYPSVALPGGITGSGQRRNAASAGETRSIPTQIREEYALRDAVNGVAAAEAEITAQEKQQLAIVEKMHQMNARELAAGRGILYSQKQITSFAEMNRSHMAVIDKTIKDRRLWSTLVSRTEPGVSNNGILNSITTQLRNNGTSSNMDALVAYMKKVNVSAQDIESISARMVENLALTDDEWNLILPAIQSMNADAEKARLGTTELPAILKQTSKGFVNSIEIQETAILARNDALSKLDAVTLATVHRMVNENHTMQEALNGAFLVNSPSLVEVELAQDRVEGAIKGSKEALPQVIAEAKSQGISFFRTIASTAGAARVAGTLPGMQNPIVAAQVARGNLSGLLISADIMKSISTHVSKFNADMSIANAALKERTLLEEQRTQTLVAGNEVLDTTVQKEKSRFSLFSYFEDRKNARQAKYAEAQALYAVAQENERQATDNVRAAALKLVAARAAEIPVDIAAAEAELQHVVALQEEAGAATIAAGKVKGATTVPGKKGIGGGMGAMMTLSMLPMMLSMVPGQVGQTAQNMMMPLMMLSMLPMLGAKIGTIVGALGLLGYGIYNIIDAFNKAQDSAIKMGESLGSSDKALQKFEIINKNVSASEIMAKRRLDASSIFTSGLKGNKQSYGGQYMASQEGQAIAKSVGESIAKNGVTAARSQLISQMSTAISSGVLSTAQAKSIVDSLATQLGNRQLSIGVNSQLNKIFGPNGENLTNGTESLKIYADLIVRNTTLLNQTAKTSGIGNATINGLDSARLIGEGAFSAGTGLLAMSQTKQILGKKVADIGAKMIAGALERAGATFAGAEAVGAAGALETAGGSIVAANVVAALVTGYDVVTSIAKVQEDTAKSAATYAEQANNALESNQQNLSALDLAYEAQKKLLTAAGDTKKLNELDAAYQATKAKATKSNAETISAMQKAFSKASPGTFGMGNQQQALLDSVDKAITSRAKDTKQEAQAATLISAINSLNAGGASKFGFKALVSSGQLGIGEASTAVNLFGNNINRVTNMVKKFGSTTTNSFLDITGGITNLKDKLVFTARFEKLDPQGAEQAIKIFTDIANQGGTQQQINAKIMFYSNVNNMNEYIRQLNQIAVMKEKGKLNFVSSIKQLVNLDVSGMKGFQANQKYFEGLKDEYKVTYLQSFVTTFSSFGSLDEYRKTHPYAKNMSDADLLARLTRAANRAAIGSVGDQKASDALAAAQNQQQQQGGGGSGLSAADQRKLNAYNKELKALQAKQKALEDINKELDRQKKFEDEQMQRTNDMKQAMITGDYVKAAMLKQESAYAKVQYDKETLSIALQKKIDALQAKIDALTNKANSSTTSGGGKPKVKTDPKSNPPAETSADAAAAKAEAKAKKIKDRRAARGKSANNPYNVLAMDYVNEDHYFPLGSFVKLPKGMFMYGAPQISDNNKVKLWFGSQKTKYPIKGNVVKLDMDFGGNLPAIGRFANGGFISGMGTGTSDSILARVSNGEYVMKASAVNRIGLGNLNAMNAGSSTVDSSSVYNVTMTINGANANANDIADQVIRKLNNLSIKNNKTNRIGK